MAWAQGYIELDCGHRIGTDRWDDTFVGDDVRCPQCRKHQQVTRMSRVRDALPSRDAKFGEATS